MHRQVDGNEYSNLIYFRCWIPSEQPYWRLGIWYGPLLIFFIFVITMYTLVLKKLYSQKSSGGALEGEASAMRWKSSMKLTRYPLVFILLWALPIVNRVQNTIAGDDGIFILNLLHTICVALQGALNSVIYCYDENIFAQCTATGIRLAISKKLSKEKQQSALVHEYQIDVSSEENAYTPE